MNEKTRYEIMKTREFLKGYHAEDAGAEETDQQQKLSSIPCLQAARGTAATSLPADYTSLSFSGNIMELIGGRESRRNFCGAPRESAVLPDIKIRSPSGTFHPPVPAMPLRPFCLSTRWRD